MISGTGVGGVVVVGGIGRVGGRARARGGGVTREAAGGPVCRRTRETKGGEKGRVSRSEGCRSQSSQSWKGAELKQTNGRQKAEGRCGGIALID